jgi:hypothetical protein
VAMAENVLVIWLSDSLGTEELVLLPEAPDDELLPQAAITRAALPATAVSATLLVTECKGTTSLWAGTCRASGLATWRKTPQALVYLGKQ